MAGKDKSSKEHLAIEEIVCGSKYSIQHCEGAIASLEEALKRVKSRERSSLVRSMLLQLRRLADGHPMSKENFPSEGKLPMRHPVTNSEKFNAFKKIPLRGYCWLSIKYPNRWYVSHYVYKNYDELKDRDALLVNKNWEIIER